VGSLARVDAMDVKRLDKRTPWHSGSLVRVDVMDVKRRDMWADGPAGGKCERILQIGGYLNCHILSS